MIDTEDRAHAELGGSSAHVWVTCPGSVFLKRKLDATEPSKAMLDGTKAHALAASIVENFLLHKEDGIKIKDFEADFRKLELDDDYFDAVNLYCSHVWEFGLEQSVTDKLWGIEETFFIDEELKMFGSLDFWAIYLNDKAQRTGYVLDLKTGKQEVDAKKNAQLAFYAVALRKFVRSIGKDLDIIKAAISQPRSIYEDVYKEAKFTSKQLDVWEEKFYKAARLVYTEQKPKFKVGEHCSKCSAKAICPKFIEKIEKRTELMIASSNKIAFPEPETLSEEQLARITMASDDIKSFLKVCAKYVLNRQLLGHKFPGIKVVQSKPRRCWISDISIVEKKLIDLGVKDVYIKKIRPFGPIEKALGKGKLDSLLTTYKPKATIVEDSDPRPAISSGVDLLQSFDDDE